MVMVCDFSIRRKHFSAGLGARHLRKNAKSTFAMRKKRLGWAKVVEVQFRNDWSKVRNINFLLINQLNLSTSFLFLKLYFLHIAKK